MSELLTREKWTRGIGNDACKIYDQDRHLVAETIRPEDGTKIVDTINACAALRQQLATVMRELATVQRHLR